MLYPVFLMVLLTFVVGFITVKVRFASVKKGDVSAKYFKLMDGENVPKIVTKTSRNFNNQFEVPVLFYVVCCLFISLQIESEIAVIFAWLFVVSRIVHSYIHLTYNYIIHRMLSFWAGLMFVLGLWITLFIHQI
ncbi:MAPEG family protein [Pseudocolwellia sp. HL-MZ19]|uniref:MAPEG family protein n=1 Tax=unclassified Pseudocolwellia TaxID=2848178 RepID=UPI003CF7DD10